MGTAHHPVHYLPGNGGLPPAADPDYSPRERELWPLVNRAVLDCLKPHPEFLETVRLAARDGVQKYRGWCNPDPPRFARPADHF